MLQLIGIIVIKSKETRVVMYVYASRYFSGHLVPIIQSWQVKLGIKFPIEYLQV